MLHPEEIAHFHRLAPQQQPQFVASRWAVKEAVVKAAGKRLLFPEMQVGKASDLSDPRPQLLLEGAAQDMFRQHRLKPHVSLSHDGEYAIAYVVLEERA